MERCDGGPLAIAPIGNELLDAEALRIVIAFYCIMEPEKRTELLALVERYARESRDAVERLASPLAGS